MGVVRILVPERLLYHEISIPTVCMMTHLGFGHALFRKHSGPPQGVELAQYFQGRVGSRLLAASRGLHVWSMFRSSFTWRIHHNHIHEVELKARTWLVSQGPWRIH